LSADIKRAGDFLEQWKNVGFDITPGSEMYFNFSRQATAWRFFFIRYQDRILFGTDNFGVSPAGVSRGNIGVIRRFLEGKGEFAAWGGKLQGLNLPQQVLKKIYHENFIQYAGKIPKKLNLALALGKGRMMLDPSRKCNIKKHFNDI
jgi:hypothetical protein